MTDLLKLVKRMKKLPDAQYEKLLDMLTTIYCEFSGDLLGPDGGESVPGERETKTLVGGSRSGQTQVVAQLRDWFKESEAGKEIKTLERLCALYLRRMRQVFEEENPDGTDPEEDIAKERAEVLKAFVGMLSESDVNTEIMTIIAEEAVREGRPRIKG